MEPLTVHPPLLVNLNVISVYFVHYYAQLLFTLQHPKTISCWEWILPIRPDPNPRNNTNLILVTLFSFHLTVEIWTLLKAVLIGTREGEGSEFRISCPPSHPLLLAPGTVNRCPQLAWREREWLLRGTKDEWMQSDNTHPQHPHLVFTIQGLHKLFLLYFIFLLQYHSLSPLLSAHHNITQRSETHVGCKGQVKLTPVLQWTFHCYLRHQKISIKISIAGGLSGDTIGTTTQ